ncbi:hypothetical protein KIN20_018756 [Parelaphostrongylus tenuis]|uniref:Uncharacterized protein n=1 Tax=Parelaphostrongylus tenuis TaxID=148309 RepID=A0AAD5MK18_PARTN|nr:hypothetical protein KIN20_018756 [Parelaphostrongylus tenuis]
MIPVQKVASLYATVNAFDGDDSHRNRPVPMGDHSVWMSFHHVKTEDFKLALLREGDSITAAKRKKVDV